jgi:hypothetical protein
MTSNHDDRLVERYHAVSCCWPFVDDRGAALFWGAALLVLGGVWLAANTVGLDSWGEWLVPALFVVWGGVLLPGSRADRRVGRNDRARD